MTTSITQLLFSSLALVACAGDAPGGSQCEGGKCDGGTVDQSCTDPHYGDGVCQVSLSCSVPDIDCFVTFDKDADASPWYAAIEQATAQEQGRAPRKLVPESDPRFQRIRALLDRGWDAFRTHRPVGKLGDKRPALVVIEDPVPQAFVAPDPKTQLSSFVVMVQTGLFENQSFTDDGGLGVMMHELQHAVGLHLIQGHADAIRKFYIAPDGMEPIGAYQTENSDARDAGMAWRDLAADIGAYDDDALDGFSLAGTLDQVFTTALGEAEQQDPTSCDPAASAYGSLRDKILATKSPLDRSIADPVQYQWQITDALLVLQDQCFATYNKSFLDVYAQVLGVSVTDLTANASPADLALVKDKPFFDGFTALVNARREAMRQIETTFGSALGRPWTALRFYSYEENADDTSVTVLRGVGVDPAALASVMVGVLPGDMHAQCLSMLDQGIVPYGPDLLDEHHGTCWRAGNIRRFAAAGMQREVPEPDTIAIPHQHQFALPPRLSDSVMY